MAVDNPRTGVPIIRDPDEVLAVRVRREDAGSHLSRMYNLDKFQIVRLGRSLAHRRHSLEQVEFVGILLRLLAKALRAFSKLGRMHTEVICGISGSGLTLRPTRT